MGIVNTSPSGSIYNFLKPYNFMGVVKHRICKWCRCVMYEGQRNNSVYCSQDCKEECFDWLTLCTYKKHKKNMLEKYHKTKKLKGRISQKPYTARKKAYYQANKEKIKAQMREVRRKYRLKLKQEKNGIHI